MFKKIISFSLIIGSVVFAFLIITSEPETVTITAPKNNPANLKTASVSDNLVPTDETAYSAEKNSTEELTARIAEELVNLNPDGPISADNQQWINIEKPEELVSKVLARELESFNPATLRAKVNLSELNVVTTESESDYERNFQKAIIENIGKTNNGQDLATTEIPKIINSYEKLAAELYKMAVPKNLATLHQKGLELLLTQKNIFEVINNYEADPAKAVIAIQLMPTVEKEIKDFSGELERLINS